ncbi:50S ribosomal subunit protein L17 [Candidatus Hodgkinia cicadicola]|nr:50S ribosomal subunit protein L17 [Candidatus Hodgkinia cicadicola]
MSKINYIDRALIKAFVFHSRVVSISQRLKRVRPKLEKLISLARQKAVKFRIIRLVRARLECDYEFASRVLLLSRLCRSVNGGYIRLLKLGKRRGDGAHMSIMLLSAHSPLAHCN